MILFLIALSAVPIACLVACFVAATASTHVQAVAVLERWAKREGYRVVRRERRDFFRGPHFGGPGRDIIFKVTVEDRAGVRRVAWVDCGNSFWDDDPRPEVLWDPDR